MNRLKELRKNKGVSQQDIAEYLNLSRISYLRYENGQQDPSTETLSMLADYFGVTTDYLLGLDNTPKRETTFRWLPLATSIPAGELSEIDDYIVGYVEVPQDRYPKDWELGALKVKGNSMEPRILDGDIVIYRLQPDANNGDIAIVRANGNEFTLKKIKKTKEGIMLIPSNPDLEPTFYNNEQIAQLPVEIIGVVIELRGQF